MKRLLSLLITALVAVTASAQFADGYYRLQSKETGRYVAVHNSYVDTESAKGTGQVELYSLETIAGFDNIVNDPGSIIYLKSTPSGWVIESQGFTTEGRNLYLQFTQVDDAYLIWTTVTYQGAEYTRYLRDCDEEDGKGYITTDAGKTTSWHWYITPISDDNYFGLKGETKVGESYYTTFFAAFPIQLGSGMTAYAVNDLTNNSCKLQEIGSVVPKRTPAVIACAGPDAASNKVTLLTENAAYDGENALAGVFFCYPVLIGDSERRQSPYWNTVDYNPEIMRVIGDNEGKLAFITAASDLKYMPANKSFLPVAAGSAAIITTDGTTGIKGIQANQTHQAGQATGTYTLNGVRVPDNVTPQKGIYIENGKKVVKK